eukprot:2387399-Alexandrium_andersonii.AAC.1
MASLQGVDDRVAVALAFAARLDNVSNNAVSHLLRTAVPRLLDCVPDCCENAKAIAHLLERRSIDRSRAL